MPSPRVLAVDSGAGHAACAVFTSDKSGKLALQQFALDAFNPDTALEAQWGELTKQALSTIAQREKFSGPCALSVPGHLTLTKFIKTPAIDRAKRDKIIAFEAQQNIPYPLPEVAWDHVTVHEDAIDLEVMLTAVKLDVTESLCRAASSARLQPQCVMPSTLALLRAFRYNYPETQESALIVSIGARSTNLLFVDKDNRYFIRTITLAGNSVTQHLAEELKQDFAHAESLKVQVLSGTSELPEASPTRAAVMAAAHSFVGRLHLEITRSTVNYRRQSGAEQPVCVYVTGGGSLIGDLPVLLAEKLKIRVERLDPLRRVEVGPKLAAVRERAHVLTDLVGLAVGPLHKHDKDVNLLPPSIGRAQEFRRRQPVLLGAAALVAFALLLPAWHYHRIADAAIRKAAEVDAQMRPLTALRTRNEENLAKIEAAKQQIEAIHDLVETKSNWINFFTDLQERLVQVDDVWLENLQVLRASGADAVAPAAQAQGLFGAASAATAKPATAVQPASLRLNLTGRLLDRKNPVSKVSQDSYNRVKTLLSSFVDSQFISAVEGERFDNRQPGILRFDFILVVDPQTPL